MSAVHTPGPWAVGRWGGTCHKDHQHWNPRDPCVYDYVFDATETSHVSVADLEVHREFVGMDENICVKNNPADARLIAAAPDLLAACQSLLRDMRAVDSAGTYGLELQVSMDQAYKAIAKATGSAA